MISQQEILISIDPKYKRCSACKKWIHIENNNILQTRLHGIRPPIIILFTNCPICNGYSISKMTNIEKREIEEVYGNLYSPIFYSNEIYLQRINEH